jgi:hypothetical protein
MPQPLITVLKGANWQPYDGSMPDTEMGINIALGDVDRPQDGDAKMGIRHENWFSGCRANRTHIVDFGTLWLMH